MADLSKAEKLLISAANLMADGKNPFTAEDLIVQAFRDFAQDFALKGYPEYPHSNAVLTQVMGKKAPLIVKGWLQKTGTNQYLLTDKGMHDVDMLDVPIDKLTTIHVERSLEEKFGRLLTSQAYELYKSDQGDEITFHHYCRFVGLSARDRWQKVEGRLSMLEHLVGEAEKLGEAGETVRIHFRKRQYTFSPEDLRLLRSLADFLMSRFKGKMSEWKQNALQLP